VGELKTRTVPNPEYEDLTDLLERARSMAVVVAGVLERPAALMSQDRVWTGPTAAAAFALELDGRRADLPLRFEAFIDAVTARRAAVPPSFDVPVSEL